MVYHGFAGPNRGLYRIIRVKNDEMILRRMRIADFAGVAYGILENRQATDGVKVSASPYAALCGIARGFPDAEMAGDFSDAP